MDKLPTISVNGQHYDATSAAFSIEDRSFRFGDGFFQTIAIHRGVPYQWVHHERAMQEAASIGRIALPENARKWIKLYLKQTGLREGIIRITVSRGVGSKGYLPTSNKTMVLIEGLVGEQPKEMANIAAFTSNLCRYPASVLPGKVKWNQGLNNSLALLEAQDAGCETAIQLTHDGLVSEAANGNLFWEKDGQLFTPCLSTNCVDGSTRAAIIRAIEGRVKEVRSPLSEMLCADAVYISNSKIILAQITEIKPQGIAFDGFESPLFNTLIEDRAAHAAHHQEAWL